MATERRESNIHDTGILVGRNPDKPTVVGVAGTTKVSEKESEDMYKKTLPRPVGYKILCAVPEIEDKFESGLIKSDLTKHYEEILTTVLFVISMGADCYSDTVKFPNGPWCKEGDFILVRPHAGTRVKVFGKEFRIINDDVVEGVVDDPRGISRA